MDDLIEDGEARGNAPEFTVSEISGAVKRVIEGEFGRVRVRGEVGRVFAARSGHLYFDLKDERSVLASVTWKGQVGQLRVRPEEGMEVIATGRLTTFASQSKYQLNVDDIRPAGIGALMAMLEKRKKTLEAEGLFAAERKKPLPFLPDVIGVVTSPSGAVIRDILHRLRERFPRRVLIWPVAVQGERCAPDVANAIAGFNRLTPGGAVPRPDLLIVARGGGSIEDLWGFNEEIVARAAAASEIPLISAVGHETDTTLIDFVSDRRAPTPTAAAEIAVPVRLDLLAWAENQGARLSRGAGQAVSQRRQRLRDLSRALPRPDALLEQARQRLDRSERDLPNALRRQSQVAANRLLRVAGAVRPRLLASHVGRERQRFQALAGRLAPSFARIRQENLRRIAEDRSRLAETSRRLAVAWDRSARQARERLESMDRLRRSLGYEQTLGRGYALVWSGKGLVASAAGASKATALEIQFSDGRINVAPSASPARSRGGEDEPPPDQGSLF